MKPSIISVVVAAILLAGAMAARAQPAEDGISSVEVRATHHSSRSHRARTNGSSEPIADTSDSEAFARLPSVFRNCEEPLPWYCARPTGSLWFGSIETLHRYRRTARVRPEILRQW